ncbi:hypothetical protein E3N88_24029 [Mikania micrantha]|uniref:Uncharacterized protein n=1 Tax=Mikania micrantha TaxID=192012 RepID=A0A5N6NHM3_9ASTR|nr:hypothetical protein E3N88_24029 [Mikania micrantha]
MGLQEVGASLKLDKTEAMLQPLTMHAEDFPPLSNLYDDGDCSGSGIIGSFRQSEELRCLITIIYCPFTGIHKINGVIGSALGCAYRRGLPSVSTTRNAVVLEHLMAALMLLHFTMSIYFSGPRMMQEAGAYLTLDKWRNCFSPWLCQQKRLPFSIYSS